MQDLAPDADASERRPVSLQLSVGVILAQALALAALAAVVVVKTATGHPHSLAAALLGAALALVAAAVLALCARGIRALRPAARTPVVVLELVALPVSYSLAFQAHRVGDGAPIMISALAVLYLLFTPASRAILDRQR